MSSSDQEIVSERVLDASPEQVFEAYRDPARLARWWGPSGFSSTFKEFDFRPGGAWKFTMHGPDGTDYYNESEFIEIDAPRRIVLEHLRPMHRFMMTMTLTDLGGKTRLTWRLRFESTEECERVKQFVVPANEQNLDRLADELSKM
jgi:uncharacterized protein YndB with AHSA1/START domain